MPRACAHDVVVGGDRELEKAKWRSVSMEAVTIYKSRHKRVYKTIPAF